MVLDKNRFRRNGALRFLWSCLFVLVAGAVGPAAAAPELTYVDLVNDLVDLEGLSVLPQPGEKCSQWSSYDRESRYDEQSGKYVKWDANGDGRGIIRTEGDLQVLAEMEGPGCIRRIWSAEAKQGRVMIYLDGAKTPTIDLPFLGYFDRKNPPFIYRSLVHNVSSGWNCYVPIPYQKSCKIVAEKDWGNYYHFTYTTFPKGTRVPTFKMQLSPEETAALERVDRLLTDGLGRDPAGERPGEATERNSVRLAQGQSALVAALRGPRAITAFKVRLDTDSLTDVAAALREVVLRIAWDGESSPSVWTPLGDFFGTAPDLNKYKSLPLGMTDDGFYCYWYMPFESEARIEMVNEGPQTVSIETFITHAPLTKPISELGRFHVKWHRDAFLPREPERAIDWTMLKAWGTGRFCGVMLHVWNPSGGWWGEGDEKFFVDGEKFPSTFGTGSEDYFGYAWCNPGLFQNAFHNQTLNENKNAGHVSVNRWHIADNVPFQRSFEAAIEKYYPNDKPTLYACTAYWYQAPGRPDMYSPVSPTERTGFYNYSAPFVEGAIEGESLKALEKTAGDLSRQNLGGREGKIWSRNTHLWWTGAKPGDKLVLALPVKNAGRYDVRCNLTKAVDYGIVQLYLDDQKVGGPIDLYNDGVVPTGEISLGTMELSAGQHKLCVEIVGANDKAVKSYMFGIDYVRLAEPK